MVRGSVGDAVEVEVVLVLWAVSFLYALTVRRFSAVVVTLLRQVVRVLVKRLPCTGADVQIFKGASACPDRVLHTVTIYGSRLSDIF